MVDIMTRLHQYVPMSESFQDAAIPDTSQTVTVAKASVYQILMGGNQLTAARARSALKDKANEDTPSLQLEGFVPVIEETGPQKSYSSRYICAWNDRRHSFFGGH